MSESAGGLVEGLSSLEGGGMAGPRFGFGFDMGYCWGLRAWMRVVVRRRLRMGRYFMVVVCFWCCKLNLVDVVDAL